MKPGWLVLANGMIFRGRSIGAEGAVSGEVVFQTGMTGYQEVLSDPSYCGQIVTFTCPHIGNVGVTPEDAEAAKSSCKGLIMHDYCAMPSNWRSAQPLHRFLKQQGIVALEGIDTRAVTRAIRDQGAMPGIISTTAHDPQTLIAEAQAIPTMVGQELVSQVSCEKTYQWTKGSWGQTPPESTCNIVVYDFGVKQNILRCLVDAGANVHVVPAKTKACDVLQINPDGVLLSNGPGDPAAVDYVIPEIGKLLGKVPVFGICLGHQLLALALGGQTYKLPFGHHGANQPVQDLMSKKVTITSQNHGFAVDMHSLPSGVEVTHRNLNDQTVAGFRSEGLRAWGVQYHPEASPGPHDAAPLFDDFLQECHASKDAKRVA